MTVPNDVVERFALAAESNPKLEVDLPAISRALTDYSEVPDLERHALDCAEWLASQKGRRCAAPTLRRWLRDKQNGGSAYRGNDERLTQWINWCKLRLPDADPQTIERELRAHYEAGKGPMMVDELAKRVDEIRRRV